MPIALLALMGMTGGAAAWGAVVNGGFETPAVSYNQTIAAPGSFTGWIVDSGSVDITPSPPWGWQPAAGGQSLDLSGDNAGAVHQDLPTTTGTWYSLRFAFAGNPTISSDPGCGPGDRIKTLRVLWNDAVVATLSFDTTGRDQTNVGWTQKRILVLAGGASSRVQFESLTSGRCGPVIDQVDLVPPDPKETSTTVTVTPSPSVYAESVTFTAHVASAAPAIPPAGTVQFRVDGTAAGVPVAVSPSGDASASTSGLPAGAHTVTAGFQPEAGGLDASEGSARHIVDKATTATTLTIAPSHAVAGEPTTYTATVTTPATGAGVPTGTVQFETQPGGALGPPVDIGADGTVAAPVEAAAATFRIRATYSGDVNFKTSDVTATYTVGKADTITHLDSSVNPVTVGRDFSLTVWVDSKPPSDWWPWGAVAFTVDGDPWGPAIPVADGEELTVEATALASGTNTVQATYAGNDNFNASTASLTQVVTPEPAAAPLVTPPAPAAATGGVATGPLSLRGLTVKIDPRRDRRRPFRFAVSGRLIVPAGAAPNKACAGTVLVTARMRGRSVATGRARVRSTCRWATTVTVRRSGKVTVTAAFGGTALVKRFAARPQTVRAG